MVANNLSYTVGHQVEGGARRSREKKYDIVAVVFSLFEVSHVRASCGAIVSVDGFSKSGVCILNDLWISNLETSPTRRKTKPRQG